MSKRAITILSFLTAVLWVGALFCSLIPFWEIEGLPENVLAWIVDLSYVTAFLLLSGIYSINAVIAFKTKSKVEAYFEISSIVICVLLGILFFFYRGNAFALNILSAVYVEMLVARRVAKIIVKPTVRSILYNAIVIAVLSIFSMVFYGSLNPVTNAHVYLCLAIMFIAVLSITAIAFSRMQMGLILKIVRKTYALEILVGLILLIVSFSLVFYALEPEIKSYGDALWYCFAIVTTIGFGDFAAKDFITRTLSVVLGLYGVIVVALVTSIIVNFYNEVKNNPDDDNDIVTAEHPEGEPPAQIKAESTEEQPVPEEEKPQE